MAIRQQPKTLGQALQQVNGGRGVKTEPVTVVSVVGTTAVVRTASGTTLPAAIGAGSVEAGQLVTMQDDRGRLSIVSISGAGTGSGGGGALFTGGSTVTYSGAPSTASYLTLGSDATLTSERVFTKGNGLTATDGGAGSTYTLAVGAGTGVTVGGTTVGVNEGYGFTWAATHDFQNGLYIGTDVWLSRLSADTLALGTGDTFQSQGFTAGVNGWQIKADGSAEFENVRVRGELSASVFTVNEISATAGTQIVAYSAGVLYEDFTTPSAISGTGTLKAKNTDDSLSLFSLGSRLQLKRLGTGGVANAWLEVTGSPTNNTDHTSYPVTLRSGSTSSPFAAGNAIADWGPSGSGAITLSADGAVGSSANMSIMTHSGSPWSSTTLVTRLGNLNGSYGVSSNYYGIGLGDYSGGNYLKYDTNGGFEMVSGDSAVKISPDGMRIGVTTGSWLSGSAVSDIAFQTSPLLNTGTVAAIGVARQTGGGPSSTYFGIALDDSGTSRTNTLNLSSTYTGAGTASIEIVADPSTESITATADTITLTGSTVADKINVGSATGATTGMVKASGSIVVESTNPFMNLYETDAAADNRRWEWVAGSEVMRFNVVNDAYSVSTTAIQVDRTGTTVDGVTIPNSGFNVGTATGALSGDIALQSRMRFTSAAADGGSYALIGIDAGSTKDFEFYDYHNSRAMWRLYGSTRNVEVLGSQGIGTSSPQAKLHTYDTDGGTLHNWRTTGIAGSRVTIVPNGTGDCTQSCSVFGTAYDSSGNAWELRGSLESGVSAGSEQTVQVAGDATDNLHVKVKTDGQVEIVRNAGARTWSVCLSAWWR